MLCIYDYLQTELATLFLSSLLFIETSLGLPSTLMYFLSDMQIHHSQRQHAQIGYQNSVNQPWMLQGTALALWVRQRETLPSISKTHFARSTLTGQWTANTDPSLQASVLFLTKEGIPSSHFVSSKCYISCLNLTPSVANSSFFNPCYDAQVDWRIQHPPLMQAEWAQFTAFTWIWKKIVMKWNVNWNEMSNVMRCKLELYVMICKSELNVMQNLKQKKSMKISYILRIY